MRERLSAESVAHDATWREIERLLDETSQLAAPGLPIGDFYRALLERAVRALAAFGGAVWTCGPEGRLGLACEFHCPPALLARDGPHPAAHGNLLLEVAAARRARVVPPQSGGAGNPTDTLLVLCPVVLGDEVAAVVELFQRPGASPAAEEGYARVLGAFCARAADYHRQRQWAALRQEQEAAARAEQLALRLHESIHLDATAYAVANEGRQFLGCDRLSVLALRGRRCRALAVSGVDAIDRRAEAVRGMEQLAEAVLATGEPLWSDGQRQGPAGPVEALVQDYVDRSHARRLAVLPLQPPGRTRSRSNRGPWARSCWNGSRRPPAGKRTSAA